jgi:DNA-directed RNA polymerase subunit alpha
MEYIHLGDTVSIKKITETDTEGIFEVEGLYRGYGITIGNALRRILLSSLPGAVITQFKIRGVYHEFTTIPGVVEDVVELGLNLKKIRLRAHTDEPQTLVLNIKGEKEITAADIEPNSQVEVITPDAHIVTLSSKNSKLEMELTVEKGLGYVPVEARKTEKLSIGTVALDAFFSPVIRVNFAVENMRVGDQTDYNRLKIEIKTDGSITPSAALQKSADILRDHFEKVSKIEVKKIPVSEKKEEGKEKPKTKKMIKSKAKK